MLYGELWCGVGKMTTQCGLGEVCVVASVAHALEAAVLERRVHNSVRLEGSGDPAQHVCQLILGQVQDGRTNPHAVVGVHVGEVLEQLVAHGDVGEFLRVTAELRGAVRCRDVEARLDMA